MMADLAESLAATRAVGREVAQVRVALTGAEMENAALRAQVERLARDNRALEASARELRAAAVVTADVNERVAGDAAVRAAAAEAEGAARVAGLERAMEALMATNATLQTTVGDLNVKLASAASRYADLQRLHEEAQRSWRAAAAASSSDDLLRRLAAADAETAATRAALHAEKREADALRVALGHRLDDIAVLRAAATDARLQLADAAARGYAAGAVPLGPLPPSTAAAMLLSDGRLDASVRAAVASSASASAAAAAAASAATARAYYSPPPPPLPPAPSAASAAASAAVAAATIAAAAARHRSPSRHRSPVRAPRPSPPRRSAASPPPPPLSASRRMLLPRRGSSSGEAAAAVAAAAAASVAASLASSLASTSTSTLSAASPSASLTASVRGASSPVFSSSTRRGRVASPLPPDRSPHAAAARLAAAMANVSAADAARAASRSPARRRLAEAATWTHVSAPAAMPQAPAAVASSHHHHHHHHRGGASAAASLPRRGSTTSSSDATPADTPAFTTATSTAVSARRSPSPTRSLKPAAARRTARSPPRAPAGAAGSSSGIGAVRHASRSPTRPAPTHVAGAGTTRVPLPSDTLRTTLPLPAAGAVTGLAPSEVEKWRSILEDIDRISSMQRRPAAAAGAARRP